MDIQAHAALTKGSQLSPFNYTPKGLDEWDVEIKISHCGICLSDIHLIDDDWGMSQYPLVPGHEIIGEVVKKGASVSEFNVGDRVGIGWQCSSCFACEWCDQGDENQCEKAGDTCLTQFGGYADRIISDSRFAFLIPDKLFSERVAPLMCGGATVYSPLLEHDVRNKTVGIIGLGGLGHMALQFAKAMGNTVTIFSSTPDKAAEAKALGADNFVSSSDPENLKQLTRSFDFILNTAPADLQWELYINMLRPHGKLCLVGVSPHPVSFNAFSVISPRRSICGSNIADRKTIRHMLEFAAEKDLGAKVEVFSLKDVNEAIERVRRNEVHYRAVLEV